MDTGEPTDKSVSFGAMGDSFYEYLLKRYLLTNKTEDQYRRMYVESATALEENLIEQLHGKNNLTMLAQLDYGNKLWHMDHLACFVPGMLALGATTLNRTSDSSLSEKLLKTCHFLYTATETHIGPESVAWEKNPDYKSSDPISAEGLRINNAGYILRPETLESIFYAYRTAGDPKYQDWGWAIFEAINKYCKVKGGFGQLKDVRTISTDSSNIEDKMESFFLAETLKYLYLLFMPSSRLSLDNYVLTTEAHPLRISTVSEF